MIRREHRVKRKDDPLVPIDSARLAAAMNSEGLTPTTLARRLMQRQARRGTEHAQTIDYLTSGSGLKRCRQSRRRQLARVLHAPEEWLGGGEFALPLPGYLPVAHEVMTSPRLTLAIGRLMTRCLQACQRDLDSEPLRSASGTDLSPAQEVLWFVASAIGHLISIPRWRARLIRTSGSHRIPTGFSAQQMPQPIEPDDEIAALGLATALERILEPWLDGIAKLDYERFRELAALLNPAVLNMVPSSWWTRGPRVALAASTSPYALVDWPGKQPPTRARPRRKKGRRQ